MVNRMTRVENNGCVIQNLYFLGSELSSGNTLNLDKWVERQIHIVFFDNSK